MAKVLWAADRRVMKDDNTLAASGTLTIRAADTANTVVAYTDRSLSAEQSVFTIGADGYLQGRPTIYGADDVGYDAYVQSSGVNGSIAWTIPDLAIADSSTADETTSELVFGALENGAFDSWSGATSYSNISGDGDGDETADGWYFTQPSAASNAISRQSAFAIGADPVEARYCYRFGRPNGSSSTNELRVWKTFKPEIIRRLRGKACKLLVSMRAGANFSATGLGIRVATGTSENEDGDLIDSGGFGGHSNVLDTAQSIDGTAIRAEFTLTIPVDASEGGVQFSFTGVGTAGAADYAEIQDVDLKEASSSDEFVAIPEALTFLLGKLTTGGRLILSTGFTDPNGDRLFGWDDSAGAVIGFNLGTGFAFNGTSLDLDPQLVDIAGLTPTDNAFVVGNGSSFTAESAAAAFASMGFTGSVTAPQFTTIELGHASDTTIARASAGIITVEGVEMVNVSASQTLTNKTLTSPTVSTSLLFGNGVVLNFNSGDVTITHSSNLLEVAGGDLRADANPASLSTNSVGFRGAIRNIQDTSYTFVLSDAGGCVMHTSGSAHNYTIPPNSSVAYPVGTIILVLCDHASGVVSILEGSGVTLRRGDGVSGSGTRTVSSYSMISLYKESTNDWRITGAIAS